MERDTFVNVVGHRIFVTVSQRNEIQSLTFDMSIGEALSLIDTLKRTVEFVREGETTE